jgi:alpha-tubulin suppressor-like RCC1 family protein
VAKAPSDNGYTKIYSTLVAFAALKADGSITAWGGSDGGTGAPSDNGYTKVYSTRGAFAALKADGSITAWGNSRYGGTGAPDGNGYTKIYLNGYAPQLNKSWCSHCHRVHLCLQNLKHPTP